MAYEYVSKDKRDAGESVRVMRELEARGLRPVVVVWRPETSTVVVYFDKALSEKEKEDLDKAMKALGYVVL